MKPPFQLSTHESPVFGRAAESGDDTLDSLDADYGDPLPEEFEDLTLLPERLQELSPAKRRLLALFLAGNDLDLAVALGEEESRHVAPRTEVERQLSAIWEEVFRMGRIGIHDNFFDLGGDSILSIRIVAKANQLGMPLTSKHLFEHPTIATLGSLVETMPRRPMAELPLNQPRRWEAGRGLTPADFPEAELTQDDLNLILLHTARVSAQITGSSRERAAQEAVAALELTFSPDDVAFRVSDHPRFQALRAARF